MVGTKNIYLVVTPFFPTESNWRGAYIYDQVRAIIDLSDYDVLVFKPCSLKEKEGAYFFNGIKIYLFHYLQMPSYFFNGCLDAINALLFKKYIQRIGIQMNTISFIHTHTGPFAFLGLAIKDLVPSSKVFVQHHDLDPFTIRNGYLSLWGPNTRYRAKRSLMSFRKVDLHICISTPVLNSLTAFPECRKEEIYQPYLARIKKIKCFSNFTPKHTYVLYNGVDKKLFYPESKKRKISGLKIGCIANFQDLKQHMTLLKSLTILKDKGYNDIMLSLVGSGETKDLCLNYINANGLTDMVVFEKEVFHHELPDYYRSLDLFVLPSVFEGFGCVYVEASACGVPYMGCYDQGAAEIIEPSERDKWLIEPYDYIQLASIIEKFYCERYNQHLCKEIDINYNINSFLSYIDSL